MYGYLLWCKQCNQFTSLNLYYPRSSRFQGEYSIKHDAHDEQSIILHRFLASHSFHDVVLLVSSSEAYNQVLTKGKRFLDEEIDSIIGRQIHQQEIQDGEERLLREIGDFYLKTVSQMLRDQVDEVAKTPSDNAAKSQVLLGQQMALEQVIQSIENLLARKGGNSEVRSPANKS